jgi:predicted HicB family RNase H-like nuclease
MTAARRGREPPLAPPPTRSARVTVRLAPTTRELAQQAARAAGLSLSAYLARAIHAQAEADTSREPSGPGEPSAPRPP